MKKSPTFVKLVMSELTCDYIKRRHRENIVMPQSDRQMVLVPESVTKYETIRHVRRTQMPHLSHLQTRKNAFKNNTKEKFSPPPLQFAFFNIKRQLWIQVYTSFNKVSILGIVRTFHKLSMTSNFGCFASSRNSPIGLVDVKWLSIYFALRKHNFPTLSVIRVYSIKRVYEYNASSFIYLFIFI